MTPEEQQIAIAKACGFVELTDQFYCDGRAWLIGQQRMATCDLPDYLNDLNAIHEAEKILTNKQLPVFIRELWNAMNGAPEEKIGTVHANAAQRAEAFLKTIGKWKKR